MELGYWGIKGIAEPLRYLLSYLCVPYKEANPSDFEDWANMREELKLDFPNLPYLTDGDVKLTESDAIAQYIAHKASRDDLFGKPGLDSVKHRILLEVLKDLRKSLFEVAMSPNGKEIFEKRYDDVYAKKMGYLSKFLADKKYLIGYLTYSDFYLFYDVNIMDSVCKAMNRKSPALSHSNIMAHSTNMRELEGLKDYLDKDIRNYFPYLIHRVDRLKLK